jgi:hypothetical protein
VIYKTARLNIILLSFLSTFVKNYSKTILAGNFSNLGARKKIFIQVNLWMKENWDKFDP